MREKIYAVNKQEYFSNTRIDLLDLIPDRLKNGNLLEIGAGGGNTLVYAKENSYAKSVYGVELCQMENAFQKSEKIDQFVIANIEENKIPFKKNFFDVIICADVLEHLVDPYAIVESLRGYLKDDGVLIASIPNFREISVIKSVLIKGDFKYSDSGILDKTHLRFFCKKNIISLFKSKGYDIDIFPNFANAENSKRKFLDMITLHIVEEFLTVQYYIIAKKNTECDAK